MCTWLRSWFRPPRPFGLHGEDLAARYLRQHGYRILFQNARIGKYEVDIIAADGDTIVFVEVKTRHAADTFMPEDSIGPRKIQHLRRAAAMYQMRAVNDAQYYRFDVVSIVAPPGREPDITLFRNAF